MTQPPQLLKPAEVAAICNVNVQTVYRWIKAGALPAVKIGLGSNATIRIPAQAVSDMLTRDARSANLEV